MSLDFNVDPYFDDYADSKQFYKILFKPGRAVQARELTQLQTILQKQISRFGTHIFKEGSIVSGANHTLDDSAFYIKCKSSYGGSPVNFSDLEGKFIVESGTNRIALVKKVLEATPSGDPVTVYATVIQGQQSPFNNNTLFTVYDSKQLITPLKYFESETTSASGTSLLFHIDEGVFYGKETFLFCNPQTTVLGKYSKTGSYIVGLSIQEAIVDSNDDSTLLDPAVGSSNYFAPGADRYKIDLVLTTKTYTAESAAFEDFIELVKVRDGVVLSDNRIPIYSELSETLARRTYDESGDYIVRNFIPKIEDDPQSNARLLLEISPGKAYIKGYEVETISPTTLVLNKTRQTDTDSEYEINTYNGNYVYVDGLYGSLPTINTSFPVEVHNTTSNQSESTKIGTAYIKNFDYYTGTGANAVFAAFFHDILVTSTSFDQVRSFVVPNGTNYTTPSFRANVNPSNSIVNNSTQLFESNFDVQLYSVPQTFISSLAGVEYYYKQRFTGTVSAGQVSISCAGSDDFINVSTQAAYRQHYTVLNATTGNFIPVDDGVVTITATGSSAVIDFGVSTYNGQTVEIIATVSTTSGTARTKTLTSGVKDITVSNTSPVSLLKSDVYSLDKVFELTSTQTYIGTYNAGTTYTTNDVVVYDNVAYYSLSASNTGNTPSSSPGSWASIENSSSYYTFDSGQKDNYYDHGTVTRKTDPDIEITAVVLFRYFTHTGAGHISVNSYPIDYTLIPSYTSKISGIKYELTDVIDFRPRRTDDTTSFSLSNHFVPQPFTNTSADVSYYLRRADKVVLTREGKFKVLEGTPSFLNPRPPAGQDDSITLYILTYKPYIDVVEDVEIQILPYRRYTMKDIASLDDRLTRVEYYTSLSLLEKELTAKTFTDEYNNTLFKNGFLVDSFKGHNVGDVNSPDYQCSIDSTNGILRPLHQSSIVEFDYANASSNATITVAGIVTVPFTDSLFINQSQASKAVSVNPFDVVAYTGRIKLTPESDVWFDSNTLPNIVVNVDGQNDNYAGFTSIETVWNSWETVWTGEKILDTKTTTENGRQITRTTVEVSQQQTRTGAETLKAPPSVILNTTTNVIDQSIIPYARAKDIQFTVEGMSPNTPLYMYINGKNMSSFVYPSEYYNSGINFTHPPAGVTTNKNGSASGVIRFPNDNTYKFLSGKQSIIFCDNAFDYKDAASFAEATFFSQGTLETKQSTIISTRGDYLVRRNLADNRTNVLVQTRETANVAITIDNTPNASYSLTVDNATVKEGNSVVFCFTAQNSPPGRTFIGTLGGTVSAGDIGVALGNVTLVTTGNRTLNKAYLTVPITAGDSIENDEFLSLTVNIPYDSAQPKLGGPQTLRSNVRVIDSATESFTVSSPNFVEEGNTFSMVFTGTNLKSSKTVTYTVVSGFSEANVTLSNASSGSFVIGAPSGNSTLTFGILSDNSTEGDETFSVRFRWSSGNLYSNVRIIDSSLSPVYKVRSNKSVALEGETIIFAVETLNVPGGTVVPYTITGISAGDLSSGSLTGNVTIDASGTGLVTVVVAQDSLTEGSETLRFTLGLSAPNNASANVTISDTSKQGTYGVSVIPSSVVNEGSTVVFITDTVNVPTGNTVPYTITGITAGDISAGSLSGTVTIGANGKGYTSITLANDNTGEGAENLVFTLGGAGGGASQTVNVLDTSQPQQYILSTPKSLYNEGEEVLYTLTAANVPEGNVVSYSITGITSNDITAGSLTGNLIIGLNGRATTFIRLANDLSSSEGTETALMTVTLPGGSTISKAITINDTSIAGARYSLSISPGAVAEGQTFTILVDTSNAPVGNVVPYRVTGLTSGDISSGDLNGNIIIRSGGSGSTSITLRQDYISEGDERANITVIAPTGNLFASVLVQDTSKTNARFNAWTDAPSVSEDGGNLVFKISGVNIDSISSPAPVEFEYFITGISADDLVNNTFYILDSVNRDVPREYTTLSGNITGNVFLSVDYPTATLFANVKADLTTEGLETATLRATPPVGGCVYANVQIFDTSIPTGIFVPHSNAESVYEGQDITFRVETKNVPAGNVVPYLISGVSTSDILPASLTGNITIGSSGTGSVTINTVQDLSVETETLSFNLPTVAPARFANVRILDALLPSTYVIDVNSSVISEGDTVRFKLNTTNVPSGNVVPFRATGINLEDITLGSLSGYFVVGESEYANITLKRDALTEGTETISFTISPRGQSDVTKTVTVADNSVKIGYSVVPDKSLIKEGETVTFNIRAVIPASSSDTFAQLPAGWNNLVAQLLVKDPSGTLRQPGNYLDFAEYTDPQYSNYTFPKNITLDTNTGTGRVTITPREDNYTDGDKIYVLLVYPTRTPDNTLTSADNYYSSEVLVKDTSLNPASYNVSGPSQVNEGETFSYTVTTTSSINQNIEWNILNSQGVWMEGSTGTNGTITSAGQLDYAGYVDLYDDLSYAYYDSVNGTQTVTQLAPNSEIGLWWVRSIQDNTLETSWLRKYASDKVAWGEYHYNTYGKSEGRIVPKFSTLSGTLTISSSTPGVITLQVKQDRKYTGDRTIVLDTSIGKRYETTVKNTSLPLVIKTSPVTRKLIGTGDFVDSRLTVAQALQEFTYLTDGKTITQMRDDPAAAGKMTIPSSSVATRDSFATDVVNLYRNPSYLNRNPDIDGFKYWVNRLMYLYLNNSLVSSPAVYPIAGGVSPLSGYLVWVNNTNDPAVDIEHVRYRNWTVSTAGTYSFSFGADDEITLLIDGEVIGRAGSFDWIAGVPSSTQKVVSRYVAAGPHLLEFRVKNYGLFGKLWAENPGVYGTIIRNSAGTIVWDTVTYAAAENVPIGSTKTYAEAMAIVTTEFTKAAAVFNEPLGSKISFLACTKDPLAQTFFISDKTYPDGVYLNGLSLFFKQKDDVEPVFAEIRSTVNGYPSSNQIVPLTTVFKMPSEVTISTDASVATRFNFPAPVYFAPGEYAIVCGSNSSKYLAYVAGVGEQQIGTTNIISSQPYIGSLFKSQNATTWTPVQTEDLSFQLHRAVFNTGTVYDGLFKSKALPASFDYHTFKLTSEEIDFDIKTDINYNIKHSEGGVLDGSFTSIIANKNTNIGITKTAENDEDIQVKVSLKTSSSDISPIIDMERLSMIAVKNIINGEADVTVSETSPAGGSALAKYVTRRVTLADGFDATGLRVIFDINRPVGTSVKVYYKIMSAEDNDDFDDKYYQELPVVAKPKIYTSGEDEYLIDEYKLDEINYVANGTTLYSFKMFAIKIVMFSVNPAIVPKVKNLRVIATS